MRMTAQPIGRFGRQRSGPSGRPYCLGRRFQQLPIDHSLRNLDGVQSCAFTQVVRNDPEHEAVLDQHLADES